ncbi:MAG: sulfur oxidation c-type cytochrome SoxX [Gammaproteobacteria bacterium]|nr:MAG: sulfur oxidation c-type cytochrome SoxX [Gammaproteobacteria bacterium]
MRHFSIQVAAALLGALSSTIALPALAGEKAASAVEEGKRLAFDRKKGNCLACHMIPGGEAPGDIGPPLVAIKSRFPDKQKLRAQIWDPTANNPHTVMPPYGRHEILTEDEIDKIVEFLYTL